jgi:hypothetical protein
MDVLSNGIGKWEYYRLLKMFVGMPLGSIAWSLDQIGPPNLFLSLL